MCITLWISPCFDRCRVPGNQEKQALWISNTIFFGKTTKITNIVITD